MKEKENVQSKKGQVIQTVKKTTVSKGTFLLEITHNIAAASCLFSQLVSLVYKPILYPCYSIFQGN